MKKAAAITVGFRLDPQHHQLLAERAEHVGESIGEHARKLLIEKLHEPERLAAMADRLGASARELIELRKDVALSVQALLSFAGKLPEVDAANWVNQNLKPD